MGFKLFDELSNEEMTTKVATSTLAIEDVMAADAAMDDVEALSAEVHAYGRAVEDGESVIGRLEKQISIESALVAEPEKVAASTVVLSYESLQVTAGILGADLGAMSISTEAMEKSPVTALEISIEEKEGFLKKVVEKIKAILKKIGQNIMKLIAKMALAVSGIDKKANALKVKIDKLDEKHMPAKLDEATEKALQDKYGVLVKMGINPVNVKSTIDAAGGDKADYIAKAIETYSTEAAKTLGELAGDDDAKGNGEKVKKLVEEIKKLIENNAPAFNADQNVIGNVISATGNNLKYIRLDNLPEEKGELTKTAAAAAIKSIRVSIGTSTIDGTKSEVKVLKKAELIAVMDSIIKETAEAKAYSDHYKKLQEAGNGIVKKIGELKLDEDVQHGMGGVLNSVQTINSQVVTSLILGYLNAVKNGMTVVNMIANEYKEKKEEKK